MHKPHRCSTFCQVLSKVPALRRCQFFLGPAFLCTGIALLPVPGGSSCLLCRALPTLPRASFLYVFNMFLYVFKMFFHVFCMFFICFLCFYKFLYVFVCFCMFLFVFGMFFFFASVSYVFVCFCMFLYVFNMFL